MNLREAAQQALDALENLHGRDTEGGAVMLNLSDEVATLRTALAEEAMQRLTDVQQEIEATVKQSLIVEPASTLPTLAVHVGYRYQSPLGGWEYGDHIPAGFDTQKWAHQKIYILQEQFRGEE